jgi:hypothetical protein
LNKKNKLKKKHGKTMKLKKKAYLTKFISTIGLTLHYRHCIVSWQTHMANVDPNDNSSNLSIGDVSPFFQDTPVSGSSSPHVANDNALINGSSIPHVANAPCNSTPLYSDDGNTLH